MPPPVDGAVLIDSARRAQFPLTLAAAACAAAAGAGAVWLLSLSGWFIVGTAAAGAAGLAASTSFNYLLPSAGIRLCAIARTAGRYGERLLGHDAALRALATMRPRLFRAIAASGPVALALSVGEATARFVQDVDEIETAFIQRTALAGAAAASAAGLSCLAFAMPRAIPALLLVLSGLFFAARRRARCQLSLGVDVQTAQGRLKQGVLNRLLAAPEIAAYRLHSFAAIQTESESEALIAAQTRLTIEMAGLERFQALAAALAIVAIVALLRHTPPAHAALALLATLVTVESVGGAARIGQRHAVLAAAQTRIAALANPAVKTMPGQTFTMPPRITIRSLGLFAAPGDSIGLAGPSGVGKTTRIEQLLALRSAAPGEILLNEIDINVLDPAQCRAAFAWLAQEAPILASTVAETLRLGAPDTPDTALWLALRIAAIDDRIRALPRGLDTWLGQDGTILSGGERRRLALARALLCPAPWLLLDEPTEGLDPETEARVLERLGSHLATSGRGAIIVSHRPGPLAICRRVVEIGP